MTPDLEAEESGAQLWQADGCPSPSPPCRASFLPGKTQGQGRAQISCRQPTNLLPLPSGCPNPGFGQAMRFRACQGLQYELRRGRCGEGTRPSPPLTPSQQGSKTTGLPTPAYPLLWTPCTLPGPPQGSQSKNLLAFFVLIFESPPAPQRGLESQLLSSPSPSSPGGPRVERRLPSPIIEAGPARCGGSKCREGPGCFGVRLRTGLWPCPSAAFGLPELPRPGGASLVPWPPGWAPAASPLSPKAFPFVV